MIIDTAMKEIIRSIISTSIGFGGCGFFLYPTRGDIVINYPEDSRLTVIGLMTDIKKKEIITLDGKKKSLLGQTIYRVPLTSELSETIRRLKRENVFPNLK